MKEAETRGLLARAYAAELETVQNYLSEAPVDDQAFLPPAAEAVARVEIRELSRFEGEGGPEAHEQRLQEL